MRPHASPCWPGCNPRDATCWPDLLCNHRSKDKISMATTTELRLCTRCVLPETFPGIKFDEQGVCNYCHRALTEEKATAHRTAARAKFLQILDEVRGQGPYDVLVGWS